MHAHLKRRILWSAAIAVAVAAGPALWLGRGGAPEQAAADASVYYTCPMHPTVIQDHPGDCPICGMHLIRKTRQPAADPHAGHAAVDSGLARIALSPTQRVMANIETVAVGSGSVAASLEAVGRIAFPESMVRTVAAPMAGRVEDLAVAFTGQAVRRGAAMMRLYSPELLAAEEEYLAARRLAPDVEAAGPETRARAEALAAAAAQRLRLLGLSAAQLDALAARGAAGTATVIPAPFSGTVVERFVQTGQYVSQGQPLFTVAPTDPLWVLVDVYEQDLAHVRVGGMLSVSAEGLAGDGRLAARITFVSPTVDPATRTATVRAVLPNPGGGLKPGMFVRAQVLGAAAGAPEGVVVPASAVLETGYDATVWVETAPNTFEPRAVALGNRSADAVVVRSGLRPGDRVAVSGAFLLDSEAQLRRGASAHRHEEAAP